MTIETILYGKRALVRNEKELKMHLRKQELVAAATAMSDQPENPVFQNIVNKIIRVNRTIKARGAYVQFLD